MRWISRSLVNKLTLMVTLGLTVTFVVFFSLIFKLITNKMEEKTIETTYAHSQVISNQIVHIFQNAKQNTEQLAQNRDIVRYLKEVKTREDVFSHPMYPHVLNFINSVKNSSELHFLAWVANEEANFYLDNTNTVPGPDYEVTLRPWYDVAVGSTEVAFTQPYVEWITKKVVISSILALRENSDIYGFVVVDIMLDTIPEIFRNSAFSDQDISFLVTEDGTYIYHPDASFIMEKSIFDEDDPLKNVNLEFRNDQKQFKEIVYHGEAYYLTSYTVDKNNWKVITLIHKDRLLSELIALYSRIIALIVFSLVIIIVVIQKVVRTQIAPYKTLVEFAEAIEHGKYHVRIPNQYLERSDEMGDICNSFQSVLSKLHGENQVLEERIEIKNKELENQYKYIIETEKVASLGNLVAGVSHEINTPLGVSIASASYIQQMTTQSIEAINNNTLTKEQLKSYFENVVESSDLMMNNLVRAADLVKSFKNVAVYQTNEVKQLFNFKEMVDDCVLSCKNLYKRMAIDFNIEGDSSLMVFSYPGAYTQILTNFIVNSCTHGFKDTKNGEIHIEFAKEGNRLHLKYYDNGIGVDSLELNKIYNPFYTTNRENGNSGLGLSIVFNLVTQILSGTITAHSSLSNGLAFDIVVTISEH